MLTILFRHPDGSEEIFAASSLTRANDSEEAYIPVQGEFIARGVTIDGRPDETRRFSIQSPFGAVFVMNEAGNTVARYLTI
jgi:hypothetical protein